MPPIAQRLREPAAFVLLAFGAISTLFHTITFLFGPGEGDGGGPSFSNRAGVEVMTLLSVEVIVALVGAVWLAHYQSNLKQARLITLVALGTIGAVDLFGVVALFSSFGADQAPIFDANGALFGSGWAKTQTFFIALAQLGLAGIASWLILGYYQQHGPVRPPANYGQPPQQGQWGQPQPQQQWGPPPQQQPAPPQQQWGPPPQQQPQQAPAPQPQWGQPQQSQDADSMMTQAIPTVPPAPAQQQPPQQSQQQQGGEGGLPIGNWTAE
jgi:hypothetical protein